MDAITDYVNEITTIKASDKVKLLKMVKKEREAYRKYLVETHDEDADYFFLMCQISKPRNGRIAIYIETNCHAQDFDEWRLLKKYGIEFQEEMHVSEFNFRTRPALREELIASNIPGLWMSNDTWETPIVWLDLQED